MSRLPIPGGDDGTWGDILNDFLGVSHNTDGTLKSAAVSDAGGLAATNNLSDVQSAATALSNLGGVSTSDSRLTNTRTPTDGTVTDAKVAPNAAIAVSKLAAGSNGQVLTTTSGAAAWASAKGDLVINVKDQGALGDGSTDDSAAIQAAINAAHTAGGGQIFFPKGTYMFANLTLYEKCHLVGTGVGSTVLRLVAASISDGIVGSNFASLTGGGTSGGIYNWSLRDIELDGNKTNSPSGGVGLKVYGYNHLLHNVHIHDWHGSGVQSEWGTSDTPTTSQNGGPEAHWTNVKVFRCDGRGVDWQGPHDSTWANVKVYLNGNEGLATSNANGNGLDISNGHFWANGSNGTASVLLGSDAAFFTNSTFELGTACTTAVQINGQTCQITGGQTITGGSSYASGARGIVVGDSTHHPSGTIVNNHRMSGFSSGNTTPSGVAFDVTNSGSWGRYDIVINTTQTSGSIYTGLSAGDNARIDVIGSSFTGGGLWRLSNSGGGTGIQLTNVTTSPSAPGNGGILYTKSKTLNYIDSSGNLFTLSNSLRGLVAPYDPRLFNGSVAFGLANAAYFVRCIVPRTGTLNDLSIFPVTKSGNIDVGVYDTGDASAGNYTQLYHSGAVAMTGLTANAWNVITSGSLGVSVTAGQEICLMLACDNTTATFAKGNTAFSGPITQLPSGFLPVPGGASPKLCGRVASGYTLPATISEVNMTNLDGFTFAIICRVV